jgi:hypothetical protein
MGSEEPAKSIRRTANQNEQTVENACSCGIQYPPYIIVAELELSIFLFYMWSYGGKSSNAFEAAE